MDDHEVASAADGGGSVLDRLRLLSEAGELLSASLDVERMLVGVAELMTSRLADWCSVHLREEGGNVGRIAISHADPARMDLARALLAGLRFNPDAAGGFAEVLRTGRAEWMPVFTDRLLAAAAGDERRLALLRQVGITSVIVVPLLARGVVVGGISLWMAESGRAFDQADLTLAEELGRRAGVAVDNARLYEAAQRELAERRQTEAALKTERARLAAVLEQMPAGVIIADAPSGKLILGNRQAEEIWRRPLSAATSIESYLQYEGFHPDGRPYLPEEWPLARAIAHGERVHAEEIVFARGDGTRGVMEAGAVPIRGDDGAIAAGVVIFRDVSRVKEVEAALRASEARYRGLFEGTGEAILVADETAVYIDANPAASALFGRRREELTGQRIGAFSANDAIVAEAIAQVRRDGFWHGELAIRRQDESTVTVDAWAQRVDLPAGPVGVIFLRDATERRAFEAMREDFVAAVSHDLRNPLTAIKATAQLLRHRLARPDAPPEPARIDESLRAIDAAATRAVGLIEEIAELTRLRGPGEVELHRAEVDLVNLVRRCVGEQQVSAAKHELRLETDLSHLVGWWDGDRLMRVAANLLDNAVKYSPQGGVVVTRLWTEEEGRRAVIAVTDVGIGIPPRDLPLVFEPFRRAANAQFTKGHGFDLAAKVAVV